MAVPSPADAAIRPVQLLPQFRGGAVPVTTAAVPPRLLATETAGNGKDAAGSQAPGGALTATASKQLLLVGGNVSNARSKGTMHAAYADVAEPGLPPRPPTTEAAAQLCGHSSSYSSYTWAMPSPSLQPHTQPEVASAPVSTALKYEPPEPRPALLHGVYQEHGAVPLV